MTLNRIRGKEERAGLGNAGYEEEYEDNRDSCHLKNTMRMGDEKYARSLYRI